MMQAVALWHPPLICSRFVRGLGDAVGAKLILDILLRGTVKSDGHRPKSLTLFINHARRLDSP